MPNRPLWTIRSGSEPLPFVDKHIQIVWSEDSAMCALFDHARREHLSKREKNTVHRILTRFVDEFREERRQYKAVAPRTHTSLSFP